jgi:catecholate siderophore receptor
MFRSRRFVRLCLASLVPLLVHPAVTAGQTADSVVRDSSAKARRAAIAQTLEGVTVKGRQGKKGSYSAPRISSATRTPTALRDLPQSVTVLSRSQVADQAMQSMADVARFVPGVSMALGEGHRDAPTIRGNSTTADFFVDGVRDDAQYLRDLYNTDRIEVLKGANAMAFGRGGGGGVINRVTREAGWGRPRGMVLEGGSFGHARATIDVGDRLGSHGAVRLNGVYEDSRGFRDASQLSRTGINPTVALRAGGRTLLRAGYEHFEDRRTVDRGIPSFRGAPSAAPVTRFFGDAVHNQSQVGVNAATATVEHDNAHGIVVRNRTRVADYDKYYRNVFPSSVNDSGTRVTLAAYDHGTDRRNVFNQTDVSVTAATGRLQHTLLVGGELGSQRTEQVRNTGYFGPGSTSLSVPFASPSPDTPLTFRQSATDADSWATTTVASTYVQDQMSLSDRVSITAGLRYEQFRIRYHNNRNGAELSRRDALLSPRAGIVIKPATPVSIYGSYSMSYLPSSGDQFTTLTVTTQTLKPEQFINREIGVKWELRPGLVMHSALYRLDRTNTSAPDPLDATRTVQTGAQRTSGAEVGVTGDVTDVWQVAAGYTMQRARIVSTTAAGRIGASVPLVPHSTVSLWNRVNARPDLGVGLGVVHQTRMFAAIDNTVQLPGFTRVDGALFLPVVRGLRLQMNIENLLNTRYFATSHGNNNIMPGATRTVRLSVGIGQ